MDFDNLPDNVFLQIFNSVPLIDQIRLGETSRSFRRISQIAVSRTKFLKLDESIFSKLAFSSYALSKLLESCSPNLERLTVPIPMVTTFSEFEYPRLVELDVHFGRYHSNEVFDALLANCPNLETITWNLPRFRSDQYCVRSTHEKLTKLNIASGCDGVLLRQLCGCFANLKHFDVVSDLFAGDKDFLDAFFAGQSILESFVVYGKFYETRSFWRLASLRTLVVRGAESPSFNDDFLRKIGSNFPHLRKLRLDNLEVTDAGVDALISLGELKEIRFHRNKGGDLDDSIRRLCREGRLEAASFDSKITSATLSSIVAWCPELSYLRVRDIKDVDTADEAAAIVRSFNCFGVKKLTIFLSHPKYLVNSIVWGSSTVVVALNELEEDRGKIIKVNILNGLY